ncbi:hypothetical protein [Curtobacterium sp. MCSS17_016]|uniref:hypothetical protein n=1 Tax=Curtobacterium sp. MCSS17_016 TaxID=2175644 RepID=UPI000DA8CF1B|nr:hypothetical protein [Curtobacterium sp. MCSS17_016]WIE81198.1 hypothetical protein DEJ19_018365 [Curtobacterium sp. MCSS17_016]
MTDQIVRTKHTGEATRNGGHFAALHKDEAHGVTLTLPAQAGPSQKHISLAAEYAVMNPDSNGADPKHWWRRDRAKELLAAAPPTPLSPMEQIGWDSVDRNLVPLVNDFLRTQPNGWIAGQLDRNADASRAQADGVTNPAEQAQWAARAARLETLAEGFRALADEEAAERAEQTAAPTLEESLEQQRRDSAIKSIVTPVRPRAAKTPETNRRRRGHQFFVAEQKKWPAIGTHQSTPLPEIPIVGHFFAGPFDFYCAEHDASTGEAWGFTRIAGHGAGEWGYTNLRDLEQQLVGPLKQPIERDMHWSKQQFGDIDN